MNETALIGVDWGSTSVRAMRISSDGRVLDVRRSGDGVFTRSGDYAGRLTTLLADWLALAAPVLLCGMIGSDRGWIAAPYVRAPCGVDDLAGALATPEFGRTARIVPGVSFTFGDEAEVMRGEETLAVGFLAQTGLSDALLCLPGTHSKWLTLRSGCVAGFRTYMTGELRERLLAAGALATEVAQVPSAAAFRAGLSTSGALSRRLFQARARRLHGSLAAEHTGAFVSGVLTGEEIAAEAGYAHTGAPVFLAARGALAGDYGMALEQAGVSYTSVDPEPLAAAGLLQIARRANLLERA